MYMHYFTLINPYLIILNINIFILILLYIKILFPHQLHKYQPFPEKMKKRPFFNIFFYN